MKCKKCKQEVSDIMKDTEYCYICYAKEIQSLCNTETLYNIGTEYCFNDFYKGVLIGVTENELIIEYPATLGEVEKRKAGRDFKSKQMIIERRIIETARIIK